MPSCLFYSLEDYMTKLAIALAVMVGMAQATIANDFPGRPRVLRAAEVLAERIEIYDSSLHLVQAPDDFIEKVHHSEESVLELVELLQAGTYADAYAENKHVHNDMWLMYNRFIQIQPLLYNPTVVNNWNQMIYAHNALLRAWRGAQFH